MQHPTNFKDQAIQRATAIPATARSPAATDPMFFVAAPVKPAAPADPVFDGTTGAIGDPVAPAPEPEPKPEAAPDAADVPVAIGAVPVANPVDPATPVELEKCEQRSDTKVRTRTFDSYLMAAVLVHEQTVS